MPPNTNMSLSPILSSAVPPPSMYQMQSRQAEIDALEQMQRDQAAKINELSSILGPLSPMRHIPGLDDDGGIGVGANGDYFAFDNGAAAEDGLGSGAVDLNGGMDDFLNPQAFGDVGYGDISSAPVTNSTDGNDFNFGLGDGGADGGDGGVDFGGGVGGGGAASGGLGAGAYEGGRIFDANSPNHTPSPAGTEEIPRDDLDSPGPKRRKVQ